MSLFRRNRLRNCPACGKSLAPGKAPAERCGTCVRNGLLVPLSAKDVLKAAQAAATGQMQVVNMPPAVLCRRCGMAPAGGTGTLCTACYASFLPTLSSNMSQVNAALGRLSFQVSSLAGSWGIGPESEPAPQPELPVVHQDELLKGTKYATLWRSPDGKPEFAGTGYTSVRYDAEGYATCGKNKTHAVPDPGCTCGFWIATRPESKLSRWDTSYVALEVEFGGTVLECGKKPEPEPPWGYRAQWQRVLSVALPDRCDACRVGSPAHTSYAQTTGSYGPAVFTFPVVGPYAPGDRPSCTPPPLCLVADCNGQVHTACSRHAVYFDVIPKPVSWLRENLQTEIRPGLVADSEPEPEPPPGVTEAWHGSWCTTKVWKATLPVDRMPDIPYPPHAMNVRWEWQEKRMGYNTWICKWEEMTP